MIQILFLVQESSSEYVNSGMLSSTDEDIDIVKDNQKLFGGKIYKGGRVVRLNLQESSKKDIPQYNDIPIPHKSSTK